nr:hypothetical protein CFP56_01962 [Quercus suber]
MGASNATSSQGQPAIERPTMNMSTEVLDSIELRQEEQRVSKSNVDGVNGSRLVGPTKGALSNILSNEEAFQTHLKEIGMELEGHMHKDKGLHEGEADFAKVRLMVEELNVADISTSVMASFVQPSMDVTKAGSQMEQVDGCQPIHKIWWNMTKMRQGHYQWIWASPIVDLGQIPELGRGCRSRPRLWVCKFK